MNIIDDKNLIPDKSIIEKVINVHPLCKNLSSRIKNLTIEISMDPSEKINFDIATQKAVLFVFKDTILKPEYEFVLFHEFSHVADKLNPEFKYSDEKYDRLTTKEVAAVRTLWDCYIDSRLNRKHLVPASYAKTNRMGRVDYLESCGVNNAVHYLMKSGIIQIVLCLS